MHTLRYVGTNECGRARNSASTLVYAEYVSIRFKHVTNTRNSTLVYVVLQRRDPKILCLHKKSPAYADVLLIR